MTSPRAIKRLTDYQASAWQVDSLTLRFELDFSETLVHAEFRVRRSPDSAVQSLLLHGHGLDLRELSIDGQAQDLANLERVEEGLPLRLDGTQALIRSVVRITPQHNATLEGLYRSGDFLLTQCEAEGFRCITYFPDRPDVMTTYRVRLEADKARFPVLLSNGNRTSAGDLDGNRHYAEYHDPWPKPSYLFALCAGRLEHIESWHRTADGQDVALRIYAEPGAIGRCAFAMDALQRSMRWDEQRFGLNYDLAEFNIVATNDFNMGAMENKSLNIFNAKNIVADPQSATDRDFQLVEAVIAHEYFHNYTGNRVTCRDWFQLSLKEGLTVFRDQEFSAEHGMAAIKRIEDVKLLRAVQFAEDGGPLSHPVRPESYLEINNFYTSTVYDKGAEVVRLYQTLLGRERFTQGVRHYLQKHDGQAATVEDFLGAMSEVSGRDLALMLRWYQQAGTPHLRVRAEYDADAQSCVLELQQHTPATPNQPDKLPVLIPIALALLDADGARQSFAVEDGVLQQTQVIEFSCSNQRVRLTGVQRPPVLSLLRGFSAPVKLDAGLSTGELTILLKHDDDAYVRFDAAERLHLGQLLNLAECARNGTALQVDADYLAAFVALLKDHATPSALKAKLLALPEETELAEHVREVHVQALHTARVFLLRQLGQHLAAELHAWLASTPTPAYAPSPEQIGMRALKHVALDLLNACGQLDAASLSQAYSQADNMTDRFAALRRLVHGARQGANEALADFLIRYEDQPLVLDKWFAVQATYPGLSSFQRVQELAGHRHFDLRNPNKVRALWLQFARNNPMGFHGNGAPAHRYFAERVLELDQLNPQIAARLTQALVGWRRYEPAVRDSLRAALSFLQEQPGLSPDLSEVVGKALA